MRFFNKIFLFVLLLQWSCYIGEEIPKDQQVWAYALPSSVNLEEEILSQIDQDIKSELYDQINSLIIIKDDKLVFENYYDFSRRDRLRSIGRGTLAIILSAIDHMMVDGYIVDLQDPISNYLPEYEAIFASDPEKHEITLSHLLHHRSGLIWNESFILPSRTESDLNQMRSTADWAKYVLSQPLEAAPGQRLVLNSGSGLILSRIMQNALGTLDLRTYIEDRVLTPIGIENYTWESDPSGTLNGTNGMSLSSIDMVRYGQLMLNKGRWVNRRRVIDENWAFEMLEAQEQSSTYYTYGYGWWTFTDEFGSLSFLEENDVSFVAGEIGQNLYIIPHQNMIIGIQAENYFYGLYNPSMTLMVNTLKSIKGVSPQ